MDGDINYNRIKSSMEYIVANFNKQPPVEDIANYVHLSKFHFQRIFKEWAGVSPKKFLQYITINELKKNIGKVNNLSELSETVGLSTQSRVYDLFVNVESVTPNEYKTKGAGIDIDYGIHNTPFGLCLIANTSRGICALEFIEKDTDYSVMQFKQKWANANIKENSSSTLLLIDSVFKNDGKPIKALLFGTKFQIKVWEALLKIPYGQLTTYSVIAERINNPKAVRAVGTAIGQNNIACLIPCHRVIRNLGGLGGYKWNEGRKLSIIGYEKTKLLTSKRNTLK